jgi:hypothetical protein
MLNSKSNDTCFLIYYNIYYHNNNDLWIEIKNTGEVYNINL